jgi:GT2 family glycosyltransferase
MESLEKKKISLISVNYKSEKVLQACLAGFQGKNAEAVGEIILVNNDCAGTLAEIKKNFPAVKIIEKKENVGFGQAANLGAQVAQGEILFFLNPDTVILSQDIESVIAEFARERKLGILGAQLLDVSGENQAWNCGAVKTLWDLVKNNLGLNWQKRKQDNLCKKEVAWVSGAALFVRREAFVELAGFDENFFMYFEDIDLCQRAQKAGWQVCYFPQFRVKHLGGASFTGTREQKKYYYDAQEYYFQKHRQAWELCLIKFLRKIFFS